MSKKLGEKEEKEEVEKLKEEYLSIEQVFWD